jgi:ABC-type transport system substrate-binding protein
VKKTLIFAVLAMVIIVGMLAAACGGETTTTTTTTTQATTTTTRTTTTTTQVTTTTTTRPVGPVKPPTGEFANGTYGGILRVITASGPQVLGGFRGGPADLGAQLWGLSALFETSPDRTIANGLWPVCAASLEDDLANKRLIFHLRKGVMYHDGTEMTSADIQWGFQRAIDNGRLQYFDYYDKMETPDPYTFIIYYNEYTNQLIKSWAWFFPRSRVAFEAGTGGSTDAEVQNEWDSTHLVGTGPFKLAEYVRDSHMTWEKFDDYFNAPLPYLDGVEIRYVPDPVTARALMEAGQADYWMQAPIRDQLDLYNAGFKKISGWVGFIYDIWPNTSNPDSIWNDLRLREALEYALDKPTITNALGAGQWNVMTQMAPPTEWGYDPDYTPRTYDPAKARQLLKDAGYPNGLPVKMLVNSTDTAATDLATAVKQYLGDVGIEVELDLADPGRFFGTTWGAMGAAPEGLSLMWSGMDTTYLDTYMRWFSSDMFSNLVYLGRTDEQRLIDARVKAAATATAQAQGALEAYRYMNTQARLIPILQTPSASVAAPYVHSQQFQQGFTSWAIDWIFMDPH